MRQSMQADCVLEPHFEKNTWSSVRRGKKEPGKTVQLAAPCFVRLTRYYSGEQRIMRRARHMARMDVRSGKYRFLVGKCKGKRPLGTSSLRWEGSIKIDHMRIILMGRCEFDLAQSKD